jgi:hypothetical protein
MWGLEKNKKWIKIGKARRLQKESYWPNGVREK